MVLKILCTFFIRNDHTVNDICWRNSFPQYKVMALIRFFQTYVSEISDPNWRTSFGGSIGFCFLMGTLVVYTLGAFCHWRTLAWISAVFPILSFVIGIFSPESPTWLVTKGKFIIS